MTRSALAPALLCMMAPLLCAAPSHAQQVKAENFVAMNEISVPIVDAGRIDGVLRVSITLQAQDATSAARLAQRMPDLRTAGLNALIEFARLHASPFKAVDVHKLSAALTPALSKIDPAIQTVLIVSASARTA